MGLQHTHTHTAAAGSYASLDEAVHQGLLRVDAATGIDPSITEAHLCLRNQEFNFHETYTYKKIELNPTHTNIYILNSLIPRWCPH